MDLNHHRTPGDSGDLQTLHFPTTTVAIRLPHETLEGTPPPTDIAIILKNAAGEPIGRLRYLSIPEEKLGRISERVVTLLEPEQLPASPSQEQPELHSPLGKLQFSSLWTLASEEHIALECSLGDDPATALAGYLRRFDGNATTPKAHIRHHRGRKVAALTTDQTTQAQSDEKIDWFHIEEPNQAVLNDVAKTLGIRYRDLRRALDPDQRSTSYRHPGYLVATIEEFISDPKDPSRIHFQDLHAFLSNNCLITISARPSPAVNRVFSEIADKLVDPVDIGTSNYTFSRVLGSVLHESERVLGTLKRSIRELEEKTSAEGPRSQTDRRKLHSISISSQDAEHPVVMMRDVIDALREERNLFGAGKARDALDRYQGIQQIMQSHLQFVRNQVNVIQQGWRELSSKAVQGLLTRIALLGGILAIPGTAFDFLQIEFQNGFSDVVKWIGVSMSLAAGAALVTPLLLEKVRALRRSRESEEPLSPQVSPALN